MTDTKSKPNLNRRDFFAASGVAAAGAGAMVANGVAAATGGDAARKKQYAMVIDARRCYGVHACSVACKAEYKVPLGETRSWVEEIEKGVTVYFAGVDEAAPGPARLVNGVAQVANQINLDHCSIV